MDMQTAGNSGPGTPSDQKPGADAPSADTDLPKKKDAWDKAQIISGFISSVVIALVGILINISIQRAQIAASADNTKAQIAVAERNNNAQIEVTDRNNKAQIALAEQNSDAQKHVQESSLTAQLIESLTTGTPLKKQIAIIALRRSVPSELYQDVVAIVLKSESDPDVRRIAIQQARTFQGAPEVALALSQLVKDSKISEERQTAQTTLGEIALNSTAPAGTFVLTAGRSLEQRFENTRERGSIFTISLLEGLNNRAGLSTNGNVSLSDLARYVINRVKVESNGAQHPLAFGAGKDIIFGPAAVFSKKIAVVVGNANYRDPVPNLWNADSDAEKVAEFFRANGFAVSMVKNATRNAILQTLDKALAGDMKDALFLFYYTGQSWATPDGLSWLLPVDFDINDLAGSAISTTQIRDTIAQANSRSTALFLDAAVSSSVLSER